MHLSLSAKATTWNMWQAHGTLEVVLCSLVIGLSRLEMGMNCKNVVCVGSWFFFLFLGAMLFLYCSNFSLCAAEVSTGSWFVTKA